MLSGLQTLFVPRNLISTFPRHSPMNPTLFLMLNVAPAFYLVGAIWVIELDIFFSLIQGSFDPI
jgi:hypothetical protein